MNINKDQNHDDDSDDGRQNNTMIFEGFGQAPNLMFGGFGQAQTVPWNNVRLARPVARPAIQSATWANINRSRNNRVEDEEEEEE